MFNWGRMWRYDLATGHVAMLDTTPQEYVNYPSAGGRWMTWWGAVSSLLGVYDLGRDEPRVIERYPADGNEFVMRPHVAGDLIVWMYVIQDQRGETSGELRYAQLPVGSSSGRNHAAAGRPVRSLRTRHPHDVERLVELRLGNAPVSTWPRSITTWRIVFRSASDCLAMLAASS